MAVLDSETRPFALRRANIGVRVALVVIGGLISGLALVASWSGTGSLLGPTLAQLLALAGGMALIVCALFFPAERLERYKLNRMVVGVIVLAVALAIVEGAIRLLQDRIDASHLQAGNGNLIAFEPDPVLGKRIPLNSPGHDANGFRNAAVPDHADIVTLGDSQTWGFQATMNDNWPSALGRASGMSVYNMGVDGYGPVEYSVLTDQALKLNPKVIVIGLYLGADLWFSYNATYTRDAFTSLRDSNFKLPAKPLPETQHQVTITRQGNDLSDQIRRSETPGWLLWLGSNSAMGRVLSYRSSWPGSTVDDNFRAWTETIRQLPDFGISYDHDGIRTILTSSSRVSNLDLNNPAIAEGLRITKAMLLKIQAQAASKQVQVVVLLIPTKELVYADKIASYDQGVDTYNMQVQMETQSRNELRDFSLQHDLIVADPLSLMRDAAAKSQQIYSAGTDGHPVASGYALIAKAANGALGK